MLSVVIPAYNEENRIGATLRKIKEELSKKDELIVVIDGTDRTKEICKKAGWVKVLSSKTRLGKGGAVKEGVKASKGDVIIICDVDYGLQPEASIKDLVKGLVDINIGSRYLSIPVKGSIKRKFISRALNLMVRLLFNINVSDTQCGFKAFRREVIKKIMPLVKTKGFAFDIEILWKAKKLSYNIKEIPVRWDYTLETKVNVVKTSLEVLRDMLRIRFGLRK
jgi:glycosyltransferase involved in cell wall biosynthesis